MPFESTSGGPDRSVVIAWGSSTGYTEEVATSLHEKLDGISDRIVDIADIEPPDLLEYDVLLIGISTWHVGELQDDWDHCFDELADLDFSGKLVAFFGCGDADGYPDNFQDAMGILWKRLEEQGAKLMGQWPIEGYDFLESEALTEDGKHFVGLAIDEHNQDELTEERVDRWCDQIQKEMVTILDSEAVPA
ncbi:MAG: flavodoxin [Acidobacteriota bacterium]